MTIDNKEQTVRSPVSLLTLTSNTATNKIEATSYNMSKVEALQIVQRYAVMITDELVKTSKVNDENSTKSE